MKVGRDPVPALFAAGLSIVAAVTLAFAPPAKCAAQARLLPAQSRIEFVSRQMGVPVDGRFRRFDAQLGFDPKAPAAASVSVSVDLSSVDIGADAEAELAKPGWFDSRRSPWATFRSTSIRAPAPGRLEVAGMLDIKGITRPANVAVALAQAGGVTTASGAFAIRRSDWRIGDGEWSDTSLVADEVQVRFRLAFDGVAPLQAP